MDRDQSIEQIENIIKVYKNKVSKNDLLALILNFIIKDARITRDDYAVIASYGMRDFREVGDLDVIVSIRGYQMIKDLGYINVGEAKISKTERLFIEFPSIDEDAEIEFFEREDEGFPNNDFSLTNLKKNKYLKLDFVGNPYLNTIALVNIYSVVEIRDGKIYNGNYEIDINRLNKNISHLRKILENTSGYEDLINDKIAKLERIKASIEFSGGGYRLYKGYNGNHYHYKYIKYKIKYLNLESGA